MLIYWNKFNDYFTYIIHVLMGLDGEAYLGNERNS
jgi:hypothetical protein